MTVTRRVLVLLLATVVMSGCQRVLFPPNAPRTQFEKYDRMRDRHAPADQPDVFGNPRPALRARLSNPN